MTDPFARVAPSGVDDPMLWHLAKDTYARHLAQDGVCETCGVPHPCQAWRLAEYAEELSRRTPARHRLRDDSYERVNLKRLLDTGDRTEYRRSRAGGAAATGGI